MAFYQLFPSKDATLYQQYPDVNTGIDEILELSKTDIKNPSRIVIAFDQQQILNTVNNRINTTITSGSWDAYLRMYCSEVDSLPTQLDIYIDPVGNAWDMGTGRLANSPTTTNGVSWTYPTTTTNWSINGTSGITGSYSGSTGGGGTWYTGSSVSQSITTYTPFDVFSKITNQVKLHYSGTIPNYGHILHITSSTENNLSYQYHLSYFSRDTNTIYPPSLIFYWNDQTWNLNSESYSRILSSQDFTTTLGNNRSEFQSNEKVQLRVYARERYPARTFTTQSLYTYNKILPYNSWYQIVDVDTTDIIIPFNSIGTRLSADNTSNFFNLDMDTLEPNRYYQIQVRTYLSGNFYTLTDNLLFKVVQNTGPVGDILNPILLPTPPAPSGSNPIPTGSVVLPYIDAGWIETCYISETP
jgi:hypothetical protein